MHPHAADCENHNVLHEAQGHFIGKVLLITRYAIVALTAVLAVVSIWTIFRAS